MLLHLSFLAYLPYDITQNRVIAGFIDMYAVTTIEVWVHTAGGVAHGCGNIDVVVASCLDRLLNSCIIAVYLLVRRKGRCRIDGRYRRNIQLRLRQTLMRALEHIEIVLTISLGAGHVDIVHAHGEDDILWCNDLQGIEGVILSAVYFKGVVIDAADADIADSNNDILRQDTVNIQAAANAIANEGAV